MKRCFNWILNWFTQWVKRMGIVERIAFGIGAIIGIGVGILVFVYIDKVPATATDYEILEKQITAIQQNPRLLLKTNCNISINGDVITVDFKNDECTMTVQYDQNFEVLSTSKTDNYTFWLFVLGYAVLIGVSAYAVAYLLLIIVVFLLEILWKLILKKFKSIMKRYFTLVLMVVLLTFSLTGCMVETETVPEEENLEVLNSLKGSTLKKMHEIEGIKFITTYNTGDYDLSRWRITDSKVINMTAEVTNVPGGATVLIEHVHIDMSLKSTDPQLDGLSQDYMDDSYHGTSQDGFFISNKAQSAFSWLGIIHEKTFFHF